MPISSSIVDASEDEAPEGLQRSFQDFITEKYDEEKDKGTILICLNITNINLQQCD